MFHGKGANLLTILKFTSYTVLVMLAVYALIQELLVLSLVVHDGFVPELGSQSDNSGPVRRGAASCHYCFYDIR